MTHNDTDTQTVTDHAADPDEKCAQDPCEVGADESGDAAIETDSMMNSEDSQCADHDNSDVTLRDIMACIERTTRNMDSFCSFKEDKESTDTGGTVKKKMCRDNTDT
eukprot:TRINITY_DN13054_c0_g1_i10.p2 TRINITY_DN13054_c0_g1~~TRINITY_DN13054_c0_g1_i10.p2  ORF type:complete len:107 (+),score=18.79 TRINITY_DN13054_c0_g1_i10:242-562(+)